MIYESSKFAYLFWFFTCLIFILGLLKLVK